MQVRCPHCQNPVELLDDSPLSNIECTVCGSSFSLLSGDETVVHNTAEARTIGHFDLIEQIGRGAFGSVWKGRDNDLDRTVAVKIPRKDQLDSAETEQFLREARAAAQLKHPNIVSVHEVGRENDTVYIVSDFVQGITLADWLTDQQLTAREAAELTAKLADALEHAHQQGVIHRDLKPANIMLDGDLQPHIMDFGLAKREAGEITMTLQGKVLGTPAYMSPEQAKGEAHDADARSDVYSLGVILFELLTGEKPFRGNVRMLLHQVIHDEAPSPRKLNPNVPRDLETICLKCLEKDPGKRFVSAGELSQEMRLFLEGRAITSRPVGQAERAWRWCRRNPVIASLITLTTILLLGISIASPIVTARQVALRRKADGALELVRKREQEAQSARQAAEEAKNVAEKSLTQQYMNRARLLTETGDTALASLWLTKALKGLTKENDEFAHTIRTNLSTNLRELHRLQNVFQHEANITAVAFSPDGKLFATVTGGFNFHTGQLIVREVATGRQLFAPVTFPMGGWSVAFSNDGKKVAFGTGRWDSGDGFVEVRDSHTGIRLAGPLPHNKLVHAVRFDLTDKKLITGDHARRLRVWDLGNVETPIVEVDAGSRITDIDLHSDGRTIAIPTRSGPNTTQFRNISDGQPSQHIKPLRNFTGCRSIAFSPNGNRVLTGSGPLLEIWDTATGLPIGGRFTHKAAIVKARFSPDGKYVVAGDMEGNAIVWDTTRGVQVGQRLHHTGWVQAVAFSSDGTGLLTGADDGNVRYWTLDTNSQTKGTKSFRFGHRANDLSPDGRLLATEDGYKVDIFQLDTAKHVRRIPASTFMGVAFFTPKCVAIGIHGANPAVHFIDIETGEECHQRLSHRLGAIRLVFNSKRTRLVVGHGNEDANSEGDAVVWDLEKQQQLYPPISHNKPISSVSVSSDSNLFATGSDNGQIRLFEMESGNELRRSGEYRGQSWVTGLRFVQQGRCLVSGTVEGVARLWNVNEDDWSLPVDSIDLRSQIEGIVVLNDERTVAIGVASGDVHFWDTVTREHAGMLRLRQSTLRCINSDSTGKKIVLGFNGRSQVYNVPEPNSKNAELLERDIQRANGMVLTESGERRLLNASEWKELGSSR